MGKKRPARRPEKVTAASESASAGPRGGPYADALIALLLAVASFLLYLPSLANDFVEYDDPIYVTQNAVVQRGLTLEGVGWAFTTRHFSNWLPITWLSHMADVSLFGLDAGGHHATSALLHAANAALVFVVLRRMTGRRWPAAVVAAAFAVHPLRVESVTWIAERKDVLAATFFLLTLLAYDRYVRRPSAGRYGAFLVLYALGLMSKTMLVTLPFVLLLADWWPLRRVRLPWAALPGEPPARAGDGGRPHPLLASLKRVLLEKAPLLLLAVVASGWTVVLQRAGGALRGGEALPLGLRASNAVVSVARYLGKTAWPSGLSVFYPYPPAWPAWQVAAAAVLVVAACAAAWLVRRRMPYLLVGWLWFLGMLVPVLGLVQAGLQSMADRYTYLPTIGLGVAVVWAVDHLVRRVRALRLPVAALAAIALTAWAARTWEQQAHWSDTMSLFEHALAVDERNPLAHDMVGLVLSANGDEAAAIPHFRRSIELHPAHPYAHVHLGQSLERLGRTDEAIAAYREALRRDPTVLAARVRLAGALSSKKSFAEADAEFAAAAAQRPDDSDVYVQWAWSHVDRKDPSKARALAQTALRHYPNHPGALAVLREVGLPQALAAEVRLRVAQRPAPSPSPCEPVCRRRTAQSTGVEESPAVPIIRPSLFPGVTFLGLIVQKFGGSSVATPEKIHRAARRAIAAKGQGNQVVVVVSAMGDTTDDLIDLARQVCTFAGCESNPPKREMDQLLATGEQVTIALMAMAIHAQGHEAISFTGGQIGLVTDSAFSKARIQSIDKRRMFAELDAGRIVIVAGFQGVTPDGHFTTLGRGGSNATLVAVGAVLKADVCENYTDVDGIFTADPRVVLNARKIDRISYDEMLELAGLGASVLQTRAVEFAKKYDVPIHVRNSQNENEGTWIVAETPNMEHILVSGAALKKDLTRVTVKNVPDRPGIAATIFGRIADANIVVDDIIQNVMDDNTAHISFTVEHGDLHDIKPVVDALVKELGDRTKATYQGDLAKVSVVGVGMRVHTGVAQRMFRALADGKVNIQNITTSEIKISCIIDKENAPKALQIVHDAFELGKAK